MREQLNSLYFLVLYNITKGRLAQCTATTEDVHSLHAHTHTEQYMAVQNSFHKVVVVVGGVHRQVDTHSTVVYLLY